MWLQLLVARLTTHLARARERLRDDAGYSTETILVISLLVGIALAALAILSTKVLAKINGVSL